MKRLRFTARPDPAVAPAPFLLLADSAAVDEARLHDWTVTSDRVTALFTVDGDRSGFAAELASHPPVASAETERIDDDRFSLLLTLDLTATPVVERVFDAMVREGVVVVKPAVYRDGAVDATLVGDGDTLQGLLDAVPSFVDVTVHEVGVYRGDPRTGAGFVLTSRQLEALRAAIDLGYYEQSSEATHADVAEALGCASSTVSEHLKKAEAALVRTALGDESGR